MVSYFVIYKSNAVPPFFKYAGKALSLLPEVQLDKVKILERYLPADAAPLIGRWIDYFKCEFKISRNRNSKFGDYRPPHDGKGHRISVNFDLNPYAFLVITVHEFAHLHTWN